MKVVRNESGWRDPWARAGLGGLSAAKVLGELRLTILRMREWLSLQHSVRPCGFGLSVTVSHGEQCDGNRRGMLAAMLGM